MLITTSRKPSQRTRTLCRGLERVLNVQCVNRGKMSLRDVFLKAKEMGMDRLAVISQKDGNPNGMDVYLEGELLTSFKLTVDFSLPKGRVKKDQICLHCEVDELEGIVSNIFQIPLENSHESPHNCLWVRTKKSTPVIEFVDSKGHATGPRIYLHEWKLAGD